MEKIDPNEEITITVCGPVDAGKSTTIGVLTSGELDDGKGLSRNKILVHAHEKESGRTSNITFNPLIYKLRKGDNKNVLLIDHYIFGDKRKLNGYCTLKKTYELNQCVALDSKNELIPSNTTLQSESTKNDKRIVSFVDLAGHEKYLKTTVFGVSGIFPNYGMIMIASNTGITKLTREHIGILFYLNIPFLICITKIDATPKHIYDELCKRLKRLLSNKIYQKIPYFIRNSTDNSTEKYINNMVNNNDIIPVISISNKTGENIDNLHKILSSIPKNKKWKNNDIDTLENFGSLVYIDSNFLVPGIGLVVSGSVKGKTIKVKDKMYIGPKNGNFYQVIVRSMHNSISQIINEAHNESQSCFGIKFTNQKQVLDRNDIKKGMVLIDNPENWKSNIVRKFKAKITVLQHSTTIKNGYSPVIHCGPIRQSATLMMDDSFESSDSSFLRSGDTKNVVFTFSHRPEFIENNSTFFFMDGNTKGVGKIYELILL